MSEAEAVVKPVQELPDATSKVYLAVLHDLEWWAECNGIRYEGRANGNFARPLCQLLVAAGYPDGVLHFSDQNGAPRFRVLSIHATAAEAKTVTQDNPDDNATDAPKATRKPRVPPAPRVTLPRVARTSTVSAENKFVFVEVSGQRLRVNPKHREAFDIIVNTPDKWESINGKTRNYLVGQGWVTAGGKMTELGEQVRKAANDILSGAVTSDETGTEEI